ncbi:MAG: enolase C-terminal domain-like protein [Anaerolineales bacterium]|nr:enolase C-terminal domain-like protein [Anaerolineales bacterium]
MSLTITDVIARDIRFPTSRTGAGSDSVHTDPDYSAAYVILRTDHPAGLEGHGLTFTLGRGNELCVAAIGSLAPLVRGRTLESLTRDLGAFWRSLTHHSQLRWVGPEKGVIHLATAALVNAVWDLYAKVEGKPLWKLLADMAPEELVRCIDFRYLSDVLTPEEAVALLRKQAPGKAAREAEVLRDGYPAYLTSAGWLGYGDEHIRQLCRQALAEGWTHFKIKVGRDVQDDLRRCAIVRETIGPHNRLMVDANQAWDVPQAIAHIRQLAQFDLWWVEEPTSPDDVLGHAAIARAIAPIRVATGEHCQNRVIFKQLMQANALHFCQIDSCRLGGVNEVLAVYLLAAKFGLPVCPHAGGVGLCEYVQHLQIFDYLCVSGSMEDRVIEYVDHLHEHFEHPVVIRNGRYLPPSAPGYSITIKPASLAEYEFPHGPAWRSQTGAPRRVGQLIRLKPEKYAEYRRLHAEPWPEVLAMLRAANIRNYSIYHKNGLLYAYYEYVGSDYAADMARIAADPKTREWWALTDPCQQPVEGHSSGSHAGGWWADMEELFHMD